MNAPIQPDPQLPPEIQDRYHPASVVHISDSPNAQVHVGQEGTIIRQQTLPQKLASHGPLYWLVHFLIAAAAAAAVEWLWPFFVVGAGH